MRFFVYMWPVGMGSEQTTDILTGPDTNNKKWPAFLAGYHQNQANFCCQCLWIVWILAHFGEVIGSPGALLSICHV